MTLHAKPTSVLPTSIAVSTAVQYGQPLTGNYSIEITTAKAALAERLLTILGIGGIIIAGLSRPFPDPYAAIGTRARHAATIRPASARKTETAFLLAEYVRVLCLQGIRANPSGKLRARSGNRRYAQRRPRYAHRQMQFGRDIRAFRRKQPIRQLTRVSEAPSAGLCNPAAPARNASRKSSSCPDAGRTPRSRPGRAPYCSSRARAAARPESAGRGP